MKNILLLAKINKFQYENSMNRFYLLQFLAQKDNIKLVCDSKENNIYQQLDIFQSEENWKPDIIFYYALSKDEEWTTIEIKSEYDVKNDSSSEISHDSVFHCSCFDNYGLSVKKYLFFEDIQYVKQYVIMMKKYGFECLVHNCRLSYVNKILQYYRIDYKVWGLYINTNSFTDHTNENVSANKIYDIVLYGFINPKMYPLRFKLYIFLKQILAMGKYRIKIIEHPGYQDKNYETPVEEDLSKILSQSKFVIATSSIRNVLLKKYLEIPLSGSVIIGDIPHDYRDVFQNKMVEITSQMSNQNIFKTLVRCCDGEYDYLLDDTSLRDRFKVENSFEAGYQKLNEILI